MSNNRRPTAIVLGAVRLETLVLSVLEHNAGLLQGREPALEELSRRIARAVERHHHAQFRPSAKCGGSA